MITAGLPCSAALRFPPVPDYYREFDYLHLGELGDGTRALFQQLDVDVGRPGQQRRFQTVERTALSDFPVPAYGLASIPRYFIGSVQFSSGCPYRCEFCDIPVLYGRVPRLKSAQQVTHELDEWLEAGVLGAVYFVDDNFIGNRKATRELLPALIDWQRQRGYPLELSCEATLNIAKYPELLEMMRQAISRPYSAASRLPSWMRCMPWPNRTTPRCRLPPGRRASQLLRPRSRLGHHPRTRYRQGRHPGAHP